MTEEVSTISPSLSSDHHHLLMKVNELQKRLESADRTKRALSTIVDATRNELSSYKESIKELSTSQEECKAKLQKLQIYEKRIQEVLTLENENEDLKTTVNILNNSLLSSYQSIAQLESKVEECIENQSQLQSKLNSSEVTKRHLNDLWFSSTYNCFMTMMQLFF